MHTWFVEIFCPGSQFACLFVCVCVCVCMCVYVCVLPQIIKNHLHEVIATQIKTSPTAFQFHIIDGRGLSIFYKAHCEFLPNKSKTMLY